MDSKLTGKIIQQKRNELGLTQIQLAEKLNVSNRTISKWENGDGFPDITLLEDISKVFDMSIDELLTGNSPKKIEVPSDNMDKTKSKSRMNFITYSIIGFCTLAGTTIASVACEFIMHYYRPFYMFIEIYLLLGIVALYIVSLIVYFVGVARYKFEVDNILNKDKLALCLFLLQSSITPVAIAFRILRWYNLILSYVVIALWILFIICIVYLIKKVYKNEKSS